MVTWLWSSSWFLSSSRRGYGQVVQRDSSCIWRPEHRSWSSFWLHLVKWSEVKWRDFTNVNIVLLIGKDKKKNKYLVWTMWLIYQDCCDSEGGKCSEHGELIYETNSNCLHARNCTSSIPSISIKSLCVLSNVIYLQDWGKYSCLSVPIQANPSERSWTSHLTKPMYTSWHKLPSNVK